MPESHGGRLFEARPPWRARPRAAFFAAGENRTVIDPLERWRRYGEKPDYAGLLTYGGAPYTQNPAQLAGFDVATSTRPSRSVTMLVICWALARAMSVGWNGSPESR